MAATDFERVRAQDVELTASKTGSGATALTKWTEFSAETVVSEDDATVGPSEFDQFTPGTRKATGSVKGLVGGGETMADLPQVGQELLTLTAQTVDEGVELFNDLGDETKYGKIVVISVDYNQAKGNGSYSFKWRSGGILKPVITP